MNDNNQGIPLNPLVGIEERIQFHVPSQLTCVLNDYDEDTDTHHIILTEEEEEGTRILFSCPPGESINFPIGAVFSTDHVLERLGA